MSALEAELESVDREIHLLGVPMQHSDLFFSIKSHLELPADPYVNALGVNPAFEEVFAMTKLLMLAAAATLMLSGLASAQVVALSQAAAGRHELQQSANDIKKERAS